MKASVQMPLSDVMREPETAVYHSKGKDAQDMTLLRLFLFLQVKLLATYIFFFLLQVEIQATFFLFLLPLGKNSYIPSLPRSVKNCELHSFSSAFFSSGSKLFKLALLQLEMHAGSFSSFLPSL